MIPPGAGHTGVRILMDQEGLGWEQAWSITTAIWFPIPITILSEVPEKWPVDIFKLLCRAFMPSSKKSIGALKMSRGQIFR